MPTSIKLLLAFMTIWGTIYAFASMTGEFALTMPPGSVAPERSAVESFIIYVHATNALAIFLIDAFIVLSLHRMPALRRVSWVFGMMFFYPFALPAFWYLHIWRAPRLTERTSDLGGAGNDR
jgi:succinate dehydrogenase/fumarate reductase cytochrome b subunit